MKQRAVVFRVVLTIAVLLSFVACSGGTFNDPGRGGRGRGGGSGGGIDSALVAEWYASQDDIDAGRDPHFEITADGSFIGNTGQGNNLIKVSTSNGTITATSMGVSIASATYTISGNNLKFSNATGILVALQSASSYTGGFYKQ
jgi:hypothetical protein